MKRIIVIGTGGTITCTGKTQTEYYAYGQWERVKLKELVETFDTLDEIDAEADVYDFSTLISIQITSKDLMALSLTTDRFLEEQGYDGAVITCGTDTLEEVAYFLDLTLRSRKPVVVTGSMRPTACVPGDASKAARMMSADGPANLFHAIELAASGKTYRFGTVVLFNDMVHTARDVTKLNAHRLDAFDTPCLGALGYVDTRDISIYRAPIRALKSDAEWDTPFDLARYVRLIEEDGRPSVEQLPGAAFEMKRVEIVPFYQGASRFAMDAYAEAGVDGMVLMGTGSANVGKALEEVKLELMKKYDVAFMQVTRTGSGTAYPHQLTMPVVETKKAFAGDSLNGWHARILLMLCLSFTEDVATMHAWVAQYGRCSL